MRNFRSVIGNKEKIFFLYTRVIVRKCVVLWVIRTDIFVGGVTFVFVSFV